MMFKKDGFVKSSGDFFGARFAVARGCCQGPSGWAEYSARLRIPVGILTSEVMAAIAGIAREYGRGEVYLTARTEFEIPGISEEDFSDLQEHLAKIGVVLAACGPRMRSVVACKGSVCVHGNIDTFRVAWEIDQRYNNSEVLPHKLKVGVAGCASSCSKPTLNDVGLVIETVGQIKDWYRENGFEGERLRGAILRTGVKAFQETVLRDTKREKWSEITSGAEKAFMTIR